MFGAARHTIRISQQDVGFRSWAAPTRSFPTARSIACSTSSSSATARSTSCCPTRRDRADSGSTYFNGVSLAGASRATCADMMQKRVDDARSQGTLRGEEGARSRSTHCCAATCTWRRCVSDPTRPGRAARPSPTTPKLWMVDDRVFYVGSDNLYPVNLQEFGYIVDDRKAAAELLDAVLGSAVAMVATRRRLGRRVSSPASFAPRKVSSLSANEADGVSAPSNRMAALRPPSGTTSTSLDHEHGGRHDCEPQVADALVVVGLPLAASAQVSDATYCRRLTARYEAFIENMNGHSMQPGGLDGQVAVERSARQATLPPASPSSSASCRTPGRPAEPQLVGRRVDQGDRPLGRLDRSARQSVERRCAVSLSSESWRRPFALDSSSERERHEDQSIGWCRPWRS